MPALKKISIFPRAVNTTEKINVTSLTIALAKIGKDEQLNEVASEMLGHLYSKSQDRALRRASAILAVLQSAD